MTKPSPDAEAAPCPGFSIKLKKDTSLLCRGASSGSSRLGLVDTHSPTDGLH